MALLVPGIRKQHQHFIERARCDLFAQHFDCVVRADAEVGEVVSLSEHQQVPDAGPMHLDAEVVALPMCRRERGEVFAVAESDLERARRAPAEDSSSASGVGEYSIP